jgi:hypothetical protein
MVQIPEMDILVDPELIWTSLQVWQVVAAEAVAATVVCLIIH